MYPETGCSRLSLREVAKVAGVNLGMFHYHFKTKEEFTRRILQEFYEEFFKNFGLDTTRGGTALEKLRSVLLLVGKFARDNRKFILALVRDLANGEKVVIQFVRENFFRHVAVVRGLVVAGQKEGLISPIPVLQIVAFMMSGVMLPILIANHLPQLPGIPERGSIDHDILSDFAILQRIDFALTGLTQFTVKSEAQAKTQRKIKTQPKSAKPKIKRSRTSK
jgi:AcrR family transcriptional regulator